MQQPLSRLQLSHLFSRPGIQSIGSFLPTHSFSLVRQDQEHCLQRLQATSTGTKVENLPLDGILQIASHDISLAHVYNYASQCWNNDFFIQQLNPAPSATAFQDISLELKSAIEREFTDLDQFVGEFKDFSVRLFGNGWTWLVASDSGRLQVVTTFNGSSPKFPFAKSDGSAPLLGLSMWQHAFIMGHGMDRSRYVDMFWKHINWSLISDRFFHALSASQK